MKVVTTPSCTWHFTFRWIAKDTIISYATVGLLVMQL